MDLFEENDITDATLYLDTGDGIDEIAGTFDRVTVVEQTGPYSGGSGTAQGFTPEDGWMQHFNDYINGLLDKVPTYFLEGEAGEETVRLTGIRFWSIPIGFDAEDVKDSEIELTYDKVSIL